MDEQTAFELEKKHSADVYERLPLTIVRGRGTVLWDASGKEYIDCMGGYGVAIVGHCNLNVVEAVRRQSETLITCHGSIYNDARASFLERLVKIAPKGLDKAYLCNSGTEAVECAIKLVRKYTGRPEIVSMIGGYHGKTMGALSTTWAKKYRDPFTPLVPEIKFVPFGKVDAIRELINNRTAAVILEPIQGETGIHVAPKSFLEETKDLCHSNGSLIIFDEIQTGFGRTGRMWACQHWGVEPDVICLAKGVAGGIPMGATIATNEVMSILKTGDHSSTFGGNPLACAAASATIDYILQENLVERAAELGMIFKEGLEKIRSEHRIVREVRGLGLMLGMELRFDIRRILLEGIRKGIILLYSGRNTLRFLPPLVINKSQIESVIEVLTDLVGEEERLRMNS